MSEIKRLREENAQKDEALKEARGFVSWMIRRAELSDEADQEKEGYKCLKVIDEALASARPAPAQGEDKGESGIRIKIKPVPPVDLEWSPWTKPESGRGEVRPAPAQEQGAIDDDIQKLVYDWSNFDARITHSAYDDSVARLVDSIVEYVRALLARKPRAVDQHVKPTTGDMVGFINDSNEIVVFEWKDNYNFYPNYKVLIRRSDIESILRGDK